MGNKRIYQLIPKKVVSKFLSKQDARTRSRLISSMEELRVFPPNGDIKPLIGHKGYYRLRIGTFRVIFRIDHNEKMIYIEALDNRGDIYK